MNVDEVGLALERELRAWCAFTFQLFLSWSSVPDSHEGSCCVPTFFLFGT